MQAPHTAAEEAVAARVTRQDLFGPEVQGGGGTEAGDQIRLLTKPEGDFVMVRPLDSLPF